MVFSRAQVDDYNPLKRSVATRDVKRDQIVQLPYGLTSPDYGKFARSLPAIIAIAQGDPNTQDLTDGR
jgi:hypothetical protein